MTEQAGEVDTTKVVSRLTPNQFYEWWAYGLISGWFPYEPDEKKTMHPNEALKVLSGQG